MGSSSEIEIFQNKIYQALKQNINHIFFLLEINIEVFKQNGNNRYYFKKFK